MQSLAHFRSSEIKVLKMEADLSEDEFGEVDFVRAASKKAGTSWTPTNLNTQRQEAPQSFKGFLKNFKV